MNVIIKRPAGLIHRVPRPVRASRSAQRHPRAQRSPQKPPAAGEDRRGEGRRDSEGRPHRWRQVHAQTPRGPRSQRLREVPPRVEAAEARDGAAAGLLGLPHQGRGRPDEDEVPERRFTTRRARKEPAWTATRSRTRRGRRRPSRARGATRKRTCDACQPPSAIRAWPPSSRSSSRASARSTMATSCGASSG